MIPTHFKLNSNSIVTFGPNIICWFRTYSNASISFSRDLDRERTKMENQEKKVINDIKKMAKEGQMVFFKMSFSLAHLKHKPIDMT